MSEDNNQNDENTQHEEVATEQLQADLNAMTDNWKRALADFENYRRRTEEQSQELINFAKETVIARLLPTLDALEQALRHLPEYSEDEPLLTSPFEKGEETAGTIAKEKGSAETPSVQKRGQGEFKKQYANWQTGVNGIILQLDKTLEELGVKKIEAVGKKFDPNFHEAVREVEGEEDGMVVEEYQTGFELNGKVIRPSQVVISKKVQN